MAKLVCENDLVLGNVCVGGHILGRCVGAYIEWDEEWGGERVEGWGGERVNKNTRKKRLLI